MVSRRSTRRAQKAGGFFDWLFGKKNTAPVTTGAPNNTKIDIPSTNSTNTSGSTNTVINMPNNSTLVGGRRRRHRKAHRKASRKTHRKAHRKFQHKKHRKSRKNYRK